MTKVLGQCVDGESVILRWLTVDPGSCTITWGAWIVCKRFADGRIRWLDYPHAEVRHAAQALLDANPVQL